MGHYRFNVLFGFFITAAALLAQPMEVRILNETAPSNALVQLKVGNTEPHPITTGKMDYVADSDFFGGFEGIALQGPTGDAYGAAVYSGNRLSTRFASSQSALGTSADYPILTIAIRTKPGLANGRTITTSIDLGNSFWTSLGLNLPGIVSPGTITISNTAPYVFDVKQDNDTTVRILGGNFAADSKVTIKERPIASTTFVSANEIRVTLAAAGSIDAEEILIKNKNNEEVSYFAYLRAVPAGITARPLLTTTIPLFSNATATSGYVTATPGAGSTFAALALQNENFSAAGVTLALLSSTGAVLGTVNTSLPAGSRYMREMSEVFGFTPPAGSNVRITSGAPLKMLGLAGNDSTSVVSAVAVGAAPPVVFSTNPTRFTFNTAVGGTASASMSVSSSGGAFAYSVTSGASWLTATPSSGNGPADLTVSVNSAGLAAGAYNSSLTAVLGGTTISVPVTLNVVAAGGALTSPAANSVLGPSATFTWTAGSASAYRLDVGRTVNGAEVFSSQTTGTSLTVSGIPQDGAPVYARVYAQVAGSFVLASSATYTTGQTSGWRFTPVTPCRVADTRAAGGFTGQFGPPSMAANSTRTFNITASACGIPSTATAFSLNFTVVPSGPLSFLTAWPASGAARPTVSTLNAFDGAVTSNAAIVQNGVNGVNVFVTDATDVILDINGYFAPGGSLSLYPVTPCRASDTRLAGGALAASETRSFALGSNSCVPGAAQAYASNVTVVPAGSLGFLTAFPAGQARPNVSTLNSFDGSIKANAAIVPSATAGAISIYATDRTDVVLDVNAYFAAPGGAGGLTFFPTVPCRAADTRLTGGILPGNTSRDFNIVAACGLPAGVRAVSANITVVPAGPLSFLTVWPAGVSRPLVSTLNSFAGKILANAAIVPTSVAGAISVFATSDTHVILDINGYFAP